MRFFKELYFQPRFFVIGAGTAVLYVLAFFVEWLDVVATTTLMGFVGLTIVDITMLFMRRRMHAERRMGDRLSNGDDNPITIELSSEYEFWISCTVIDELPYQFQNRTTSHRCQLNPGASHLIHYSVRPTRRGEYEFGAVNVFVSSVMGFIQRKYQFSAHITVPVYPSFLQMRSYELLAATNRLTEVGVKRIRRIGMAREFDQIRDYVPGDEYRTINWNATARHADLMVNQYQDEKSQPVYSLIDMGRTMKMPFEGMTLLDYAINASLVISNIAMMKDDKAGLITFDEQIQTVLVAEKGPAQLNRIMQQLYKQQTSFREPNYEMLYATVRRRVHQRSLLLLYSNFETLSSLKRQMTTLSMLASSHVLCVIIFENTELRTLIDAPALTLQDVYVQSIAEKFAYEKKLICAELARRGIHAIFTAPQHLSVNTINTYLEMKARGVI